VAALTNHAQPDELAADLLSRLAVAAALRGGSKETAAGWQVTAALREAEFGNTAEARRQAGAALDLAPSRDVRIAAAMVLARSGESARAQSMVDELYKQFPENTLVVNYWLPSIRAALALQRNDAPLAVGFLQVTAAYDLGGATPPFSTGATMYPAYVRGQAYLAQRQWSRAAAEFERIRDNRGLVWNFPTGIVSNLQLARAYAGGGEVAKAKAQYRDFLTLWQDADPDSSILRAAKSEDARLP
jgi:tetratricopeptide (TPR) repeat protein